MNEYYSNIVKNLIKGEVKDFFNNIESTEKESSIIDTLIDEYFNENKIVFKEEENVKSEYGIKENKTHIYRDRNKYELKENKCLARVWNCGMGGQCSNKGIDDGFCKKHAYPKTGPGKYEWWLGTIDRDRLVRPVNHKGRIHIWLN